MTYAGQDRLDAYQDVHLDEFLADVKQQYEQQKQVAHS
jgi:hypothetical protein